MDSAVFLKRFFFIQVLFCSFFSSGAASFTLTWDGGGGTVSGYRVYMREEPSGGFERIWEGARASCVFEDTNLNHDVVYVFVVRAFNRYGESGNSNPVEYIKPEPEIPGTDVFGRVPDGFLILLSDALYVLGPGSTTQVFGSSGINNLFLESGSRAILSSFAGNNVIYVNADSGLFEVSRSGAGVVFDGRDGTLFSVHSSVEPQTIVFSDGACNLVISGGAVMLNTQAVGITPALIDLSLYPAPVYSASPFQDPDHSDACVLLENQVPYRLGSMSTTDVYGNSGRNKIVVEQGAVANFFQFIGENEIVIEADSSDFIVSRSGATLTLQDWMGTRLRIPATLAVQTIHFNDSSLGLRISAGKVMLGDQEVGASYAPVSGR